MKKVKIAKLNINDKTQQTYSDIYELSTSLSCYKKH
jgi:hypothetical protein